MAFRIEGVTLETPSKTSKNVKCPVFDRVSGRIISASPMWYDSGPSVRQSWFFLDGSDVVELWVSVIFSGSSIVVVDWNLNINISCNEPHTIKHD